jgi:hypothetical protein
MENGRKGYDGYNFESLPSFYSTFIGTLNVTSTNKDLIFE